MSSSKKLKERLKKTVDESVFGDDKKILERDLGIGKGEMELQEIHIDSIKLYDQIRKKINEEEIDELALSIKSRGLLQPIVVQRDNGGYRLIAGHCRYRAFLKLGLPKIPAIIKKPEDVANIKVDQIVENIQRARLNTIDASFAIAEIMEMKGLSQRELAAQIGKHEVFVSKMIGIKKMVEKLSAPKVLEDLPEDTLYELTKLSIELVEKAVKKIKEKNLNSKETREFLSKLKEGKDIDEDRSKVKKDFEDKLKEIIEYTREISDKVMKLRIHMDKELNEEIEETIKLKLQAEASRFFELISVLFKGKATFNINLNVNKTRELQFPDTSILVTIPDSLFRIGFSFLDYRSSKTSLKNTIKKMIPDIQESIFEDYPINELIDQWNALPFYSIKRNVDGFYFKAVTEKYKLPQKYIEAKSESKSNDFSKYNFKKKT